MLATTSPRLTARGARGAVVNGDMSQRWQREFDGGNAGTCRKGVCGAGLSGT